MIDDLFEADTLASVRDAIANPRRAPPPQRKFSIWNAATAVPRGVTSALAEAGASVSEAVGGFGQVLAATDPLIGVTAPRDVRDRLLRGQDEARARLQRDGVEMNNDIGDALREAGRSYRPDAATASTAEQVIYGFARGAAKVVGGAVLGGPIGVIGAGLEEANTQADELRLQGVPFGPRIAAGAVQGAGLALAALPAVGSTLGRTAALYVAGGPGGFVAQQALTREILSGAGRRDVAEQFDPFDPVGLAVSALLPGAFAAYGLRAQRLRRAYESLPAELPREDSGAAAQRVPKDGGAQPAPLPPARGSSEPPVPRTAVAEAIARYPEEVVDAVMVLRLTEQARAAEDGAALLRSPQDLAAAAARATELDASISALEAQRAELTAVAGDLAPPGAIREARQELRLMEQTRVDLSDAALRAAAKDIQARDGISYKAALSQARKQLEAAARDWQSRAERLTEFIERNAAAQRATQELQRVDQQLVELRSEADQAQPVVQWARRLDEVIAEARQQAQFERFSDATAPAGRRDQQAAGAPPRQAEARTTAPTPEPQPEMRATVAAESPTPAAASGDSAAAHAPIPTAAAEAAAAARLDEVAAQFPGLEVQLDGMDKPMPLAEFLAAVKAEADEMESDAPLMDVAAQCVLINGL